MMESNNTIAQLLILEPDEATRELLTDNLRADQYRVTEAETIQQAQTLIANDPPALLIMELDLPDGNALDLIREIRGGTQTPDLGILCLTRLHTDRDIVRTLHQGADDHLAKPMNYSVLLARITAILRRRQFQETVTVKAAGLTINLRDQWVKVNGNTVSLSAKEFQLLERLAGEPTRVFTKEELLKDVWGYRSMSHSRTLEAHVSRLRKKLYNPDREYVLNCWGVGYRLVGP